MIVKYRICLPRFSPFFRLIFSSEHFSKNALE
nr:MAG TPA: hypothetical protein [Caudoviricetes sp.]DAN02376.1 MAG TPA: hypothetical protein [Caudoviricetes sp.]